MRDSKSVRTASGGSLPTLWKADDRFVKSYLSRFPGHYETGDAGMLDADGYLYIMARTDDVINVAGHRLSTGAMEEVLANHPDVAECAVIGISDPMKGQVPMGFLCLNKGSDRPHDEIIAECIARVRNEIGPVADFNHPLVIAVTFGVLWLTATGVYLLFVSFRRSDFRWRSAPRARAADAA